LGNNAFASGNFNAPFEKALTGPEEVLLRAADEASRNRFLLRKAVVFIADHPLQFINLTMARFIQYWTFMMQEVTGLKDLALVAYFGILLLGVVGIFFTNWRQADVQLLLLFLVALPLPYYFTVVGLFRYRFPVEVLLVVFASHSAYRVIEWTRTQWRAAH
jgi:hypothetical protein